MPAFPAAAAAAAETDKPDSLVTDAMISSHHHHCAGACDVNIENNTGYTAVMLASLTTPDGPDGMEVVRKLMELGNIHVRSKQVNSV